jgi:UDP-glucose 4-epimerase
VFGQASRLHGAPLIANLGSGRGHSVREVIAAVQAVTGRTVPTRMAPRRAGDPAVLVAAPEKAMAVLRWRPVFTALDTQIRHTLVGERKRLQEGLGNRTPSPTGSLRTAG